MLRLISSLKCPALLSALSRAFKVIVGPLWRLFRLAWAAGSVLVSASYVLHLSSPLYYTHLLQPSIPFVLVRAYSLWWLPTFLHSIATSTSALMYCLGATSGGPLLVSTPMDAYLRPPALSWAAAPSDGLATFLYLYCRIYFRPPVLTLASP